MTYNPSLGKVKVNSHTKNQGHGSNGSVVRVRTDTQTHTNGTNDRKKIAKGVDSMIQEKQL